MIEVNPLISADWAEELIVNAVQAALDANGARGDVTVSIVDDAEIHRLNLEYRGIDRPTDVLTFPALEGDDIAAPPGFLGDVIISLPRAVAQAEEYGHSRERELSFLAVHGALHILGYDHILEDEARVMFAAQEQILERMGIAR